MRLSEALWECKSLKAGAEVGVGSSVRARDDNLCGRTPENDPWRSRVTGVLLCRPGPMRCLHQSPLKTKKCFSTDTALTVVDHSRSVTDQNRWIDR